ncbi:hypothetical protein [Pseudomonas graminis]|uniref:Uncharacterized protein n=1 Tax=Pseudomonas graminis TaxID=158627 RepID=A0A6M8MLM8_9PSED|nr:hypothetical protein [Pseudomonas graminis]QKF52806.1 hypothetical protein FX982_03798 [Pseudomonas graminis]
MKKPQVDFEYMRDLIEEFFKRPAIRSSLKVIEEAGITGWEIWFQVEFARFLAAHESKLDWAREWPIEFDYRREKTRNFLKADFLIRKKGSAVDRWIALEIKQHVNAGNCINNMVSDLAKVAKMRKSELDMRSIWALGIFLHDEKDIPEMIRERLIIAGQSYHEGRMITKPISRTGFSYALF